MAATQHIQPCRCGDTEGLPELKASATTVKKGDRSDFEHGVRGGWRQAGCRSEFFTNCWRSFFYHITTVSGVYRECAVPPQKKIIQGAAADDLKLH